MIARPNIHFNEVGELNTSATKLPINNERLLNDIELAYETGGLDRIKAADQLVEIANQ